MVVVAAPGARHHHHHSAAAVAVAAVAVEGEVAVVEAACPAVWTVCEYTSPSLQDISHR